MPILGTREWMILQLEGFRQHVSDCHKRAREPEDVRRYLAEVCWARVCELMGPQPFNPTCRVDYPPKAFGNSGQGLSLPDSASDVQVAEFALLRLQRLWPAGFDVARRSLEHRQFPADRSVLSRVKLRLLRLVIAPAAKTKEAVG
jgi:hypothetical protein